MIPRQVDAIMMIGIIYYLMKIFLFLIYFLWIF